MGVGDPVASKPPVPDRFTRSTRCILYLSIYLSSDLFTGILQISKKYSRYTSDIL